jgi:anti-sigma factor (TIGR02949 family)
MKKPHTNHDHREDIGCLKAIEMFYAYLDGELDDPESTADFEHHLEHCRSCFSRTEFENLLTERLKTVAAERASSGLRNRLRVLMDNF